MLRAYHEHAGIVADARTKAYSSITHTSRSARSASADRDTLRRFRVPCDSALGRPRGRRPVRCCFRRDCGTPETRELLLWKPGVVHAVWVYHTQFGTMRE